MYKNKIALETMNDITEFVAIAAEEDGDVRLIDGNGFCVNGKSLLGAMTTVEWKSLYCESENDIYSKIERFCVA